MSDSLVTKRLILRPWRDEDLVPFAQLNADPDVMRHFPATLSREESDIGAKRIRAHFDEHGFGLWAIEVPNVAPFVGFVGLSTPSFHAHFTPCVEVGWRLARDVWNQGYATEAAKAAVEYGFQHCGLQEIVSFTVPANIPSRRVMEKIGMQHEPSEDFEHPRLPEGHALRKHVLYRLAAPTSED